MATDFVPKSYPNLDDWLDTLKAEITPRATRLGLGSTDLAAFLGHLDAISAPVKDWIAADKAVADAAGRVAAALRDHLPEVRREIKRLKSASGYTEGDGEVLGVLGGSDDFNAAAYKPQLRADVFSGRVRLTGKKSGVDAMNLYIRRKGDIAWKLLVARRGKFPFDDDTPLAVAGAPEVREYRAFGVVADEEIGQPSDIVEVVYGG
jgi:hypothetical protein